MNNAIKNIAIKLWGMHETHNSLIASRENHTYKVFNQDKKIFVLRVHRKNYSSKNEINSEIKWIKFLNKKQLHVPIPTKSMNRNYLELINGHFVTVLSWIDGSPMTEEFIQSNTSKKYTYFYELGRSLANLHIYSDEWLIPDNFSKRSWDIEGLLGENPIWGKFWENPELNKSNKEMILNIKNKSKSILNNIQSKMDFGLIHADAVQENILISKDRISLIDFDDSGFGFRLFDLATSLLYYYNHTDYELIKKHFLNGYISRKNIDIKFLDLFLLLRSFTYLGWNITRINEKNGRQRNSEYTKQVLNLCENINI